MTHNVRGAENGPKLQIITQRELNESTRGHVLYKPGLCQRIVRDDNRCDVLRVREATEGALDCIKQGMADWVKRWPVGLRNYHAKWRATCCILVVSRVAREIALAQPHSKFICRRLQISKE